MTALPLFDLLSAEDRLADVADRLVDAALADLAGLRALDRSLAQKEGEPYDRPVAVLLQNLYEQWVAGAAALLERVRRLERGATRVPRADELRDAVGRTR